MQAKIIKTRYYGISASDSTSTTYKAVNKPITNQHLFQGTALTKFYNESNFLFSFILDKSYPSNPLNYLNGLKNQSKMRKSLFMITKNLMILLKQVSVDFFQFIPHVGRILKRNLQLKIF